MSTKWPKPKISHRLSRDLTCSICLDIFQNPVSLQCDHTFCEACITRYWSGACSPPTPGAPGNTCTSGTPCTPGTPHMGLFGLCPQCRKVIPGRSYRSNRILANIVETYIREMEEITNAEVVVAGTTVRTMPQCLRHHEELKLYCEEEHELVCVTCAVSQEHQSHTLLCLDKAEQKYRQLLSSSVAALQTEIKTAQQCERDAEDEVKRLKEHTADLKQRIEVQFSDLHQFLYQEEKLLQVKLKTEEHRELIRLDEHKALLCEEITRLRQTLTEMEDKLREHGPYTLLRNMKSLLQRQPMKFEEPTLTPPQLCEGRFAGPLQYRVWKSLKGSLYPVPSAITFNCNTANPWLSVTPSLTCVRYQTFNSSARDNPQRFDAALSLLGSQGFTHGCHYWEIEVSSSTVWTVGVARESVSRKGVIKALPTNGFWTVSLSYGVQYMAGTWPPTVLNLNERLERIGIYLDYKRGLVSFYNAESMTHIYTFHDTFTESLYPYFNLGFLDKVHENEPLKVFIPKI